MMFISTRDAHHESTFANAIFQGLAPDGGLYLQKTVPDLRDILGTFTRDTPFQTIAGDITFSLLKDEMGKDDARMIAESAFPFSPRLNRITENMDILELFHGPSCAFKDFGASFLAHAMSFFLENRRDHAVILTATSGDTGSAVAQAFHMRNNIDVVILYPSGRVSPLQEKQLTTPGGNVHALEIEGSFDDCQRMVKEAFLDPELSARLTLTSANSINLGRLLPQAFYYIWARAQYAEKKGGICRPGENDLVFCVPSGNFGNLTAGVLAWTWGMQVNRFIAATNVNDIVPHYLKTGLYSPKDSRHTCSNAMDVGNPSNFERLDDIFYHNVEKMRSMISEEVVTDSETLAEMKSVYDRYGEIIDPHTAVGFLAAERYLEENNPNTGIITLSTAHPGKFGEVIREAIGIDPPLPERLADILSKEKTSVRTGPTLDELRGFLMDSFA